MADKTAQLKPCPFCGGMAAWESEHDGDGEGVFYAIKCRTCRARSPQLYVSHGNDCPQFRAEVRNSWNRRAAFSHLAAGGAAAVPPPAPAADPAGLTVASPWVPVTERMPEVGADCIVWKTSRYVKGPFAAIDRWDEQREAPVSFSSVTVPIGVGWDDGEFEEVTHWQPLPPPPATVSAEGMPASSERGPAPDGVPGDANG